MSEPTIMKTKNNTQQLITFLPAINKLVAYKYSYREILAILKSEFDFEIDSSNPVNYLCAFLNEVKKGKVNSKFNDFIILNGIRGSDMESYSKFCIQYEKCFFFTFKTNTIKDSYIVTRDNIHQIPSIRGCVVAKRLLKFHDLTDKEICDRYSQYWANEKDKEITESDGKFILDIHNNIIDIFNELVFKLKTLPYYCKDLFI